MDNNLLNKISAFKPKVILFDFFDTLVTRKVHPELIKKISLSKINIFYNLNIDNELFYKIRREEEDLLYAESFVKTHDREFKIKDLARNIYKRIPLLKKIESEADFIEIFYEIERKVEFSNILINNEVLEVLMQIKEKYNIPVYLVSDIYWDKNFFDQLLEKFSLKKYFEKLYLSSEIGLTKRSGKIFDYIINDISITNKKAVVMIGDNEHSDYIIPSNIGFNCILYSGNANTKQSESLLLMSNDKTKYIRWVKENICKILNDYKDVPFASLSFYFWVFTFCLTKSTRGNDFKTLLFMSREGKYLKKMFDNFQLSNFSKKSVLTKYFYVSRRSTFLPSLGEIENEKFNNLFRQYNNISLNDFLLNLQFDRREILEVTKSLKIDIEKNINEFSKSEEFKRLVNLKIFQKIYENKRVAQRDYLFSYIENLIGYTKGNLNQLYLVDVGWKGTIQDNIYNLIRPRTKINGYYMGLAQLCNIDNENQKYGLIFSPNNRKDLMNKIFSENTSVIENVLSANHGSVMTYKKIVNNIQPVCDENIEENKYFESIIMPIQNKMENIFNEINSLFDSVIWSEDLVMTLLASIYLEQMKVPSKKDIEYFKNFSHYENFGNFNFSKVLPNNNRLKNLFAMLSIKNDHKDVVTWEAFQEIEEIGYDTYTLFAKLKLTIYKFYYKII